MKLTETLDTFMDLDPDGEKAVYIGEGTTELAHGEVGVAYKVGEGTFDPDSADYETFEFYPDEDFKMYRIHGSELRLWTAKDA
jgi:hypothetical protein